MAFRKIPVTHTHTHTPWAITFNWRISLEDTIHTHSLQGFVCSSVCNAEPLVACFIGFESLEKTITVADRNRVGSLTLQGRPEHLHLLAFVCFSSQAKVLVNEFFTFEKITNCLWV